MDGSAADLQNPPTMNGFMYFDPDLRRWYTWASVVMLNKTEKTIAAGREGS
jgi:hypothetical protein